MAIEWTEIRSYTSKAEALIELRGLAICLLVIKINNGQWKSFVNGQCVKDIADDFYIISPTIEEAKAAALREAARLLREALKEVEE